MEKKNYNLFFIFLIILVISGCGNDLEDILDSPINETNTTEVNITTGINESINNQTETNTTGSNQTENTNTCSDTDGGQDYTIRGLVSVSNGRYNVVSDYCEGTGQLVEYYCKEDNSLGIDTHSCFKSGNYICEDGSCGELNITVINETNSTNSS
jgi:hypothetical protein